MYGLRSERIAKDYFAIFVEFTDVTSGKDIVCVLWFKHSYVIRCYGFFWKQVLIILKIYIVVKSNISVACWFVSSVDMYESSTCSFRLPLSHIGVHTVYCEYISSPVCTVKSIPSVELMQRLYSNVVDLT